MYSTKVNIAGITNATMREILLRDSSENELNREYLVLVTSSGFVALLDSETLETTNSNGSEEEIQSCIISCHQVKVEPRLTAVVAWKPFQNCIDNNEVKPLKSEQPSERKTKITAKDNAYKKESKKSKNRNKESDVDVNSKKVRFT